MYECYYVAPWLLMCVSHVTGGSAGRTAERHDSDPPDPRRRDIEWRHRRYVNLVWNVYSHHLIVGYVCSLLESIVIMINNNNDMNNSDDGNNNLSLGLCGGGAARARWRQRELSFTCKLTLTI